MPTKRSRRSRFIRPDINPVHWAMLTDAPFPEDGNKFAEFGFDELAPELWSRYRDEILADWIETQPGTRPQCWWKFDAPRLKDLGEYTKCFYAGDMIEHRQLLEGHGCPAWDVLNIVPYYQLGIPASWTGGNIEALVFESQHSYLSRHDLLAPGEGQSIHEPEFTPCIYESKPKLVAKG